jgi:hypothetical protein
MTATPPIPQDDLFALVRAADPLDPDAAQPAAETVDALLREILATPHPYGPAPAGRRRRVLVRLTVVGAGLAGASAAAFALSGGDQGAVTPASAAVIRHALAALDQPAGTILHVDMTGTQDNGDGTTITWRDQSWQQDDPPYDRRQVETNPDGTTAESGSAGDSEQVFDPATNTIYQSTTTDSSSTARGAHRRFWLSPGPRAGTYRLRLTVYEIHKNAAGKVRVVAGGSRQSLVVTAAQVKAIKDGTDAVIWRRHSPNGSHRRARLVPAVVPASQAQQPPAGAEPDSPDFADQIRALLRSGRAGLVGHATIDGRDTLEIRSRDGHTTYYVDPTTYAPVELDTTGTDGGTSLHFTTYELLPANAANDALLSLTAQHPSATVDQNQADYVAAEQRVFPHG